MRNILITAGGTTEKIDDVRVISNFSSGKLGLAVAKAFLEEDSKIEKIYYLCDKNTTAPTDDKVEVVRVSGVSGLLEKLTEILKTKRIDAVIHAMAVSDFAVDKVTTMSAIKSGESVNSVKEGKISSDIEDLVIVLKKTPKVIGEIKKLQNETILVGFKLLTNVENQVLIDTAYELLLKNNCDMVLANDLSEITEDKHVGYLIKTNKEYEKFGTKKQIAEAIVKNALQLIENREE